MKDAVAYMAWERVVPWKILSMTARPDKPLVPIGFGARNRDFYEILERGSRIWVVTRISNEFSLAGCVAVRDILDRNCIPEEKWPEEAAGLFKQWRYVARADLRNSEFFETNNAGPVISKHRVRFAQNRTIAYRSNSLEDSFKACMDQARKTVFLSYRWKDARRFAIALAREFRKRGMSPWLDALSIPGYKAKAKARGDRIVDEPRLEKLIKLGIEKSKLAVVIRSKTYLMASWTRMEFDYIRKKNISWYQVFRGMAKRKGDESSTYLGKPEDVVDIILELHDISV